MNPLSQGICPAPSPLLWASLPALWWWDAQTGAVLHPRPSDAVWRGQRRKEGLETLLDLWWGLCMGLEFHPGGCADTMICFGQLNNVNIFLSSKAQPRGGGRRVAGSGIHSRAVGTDIQVVHTCCLLLIPHFLVSLGQKKTNLLGSPKLNRTFTVEADYSNILSFFFMFICSLCFYSPKPLDPPDIFRGGSERLQRGGWEGEFFYLLREYEQILSWNTFHWSNSGLLPEWGLQTLTVPPAVTVTDNVTENEKMLKKNIHDLFNTADPVWFTNPADKWNFFGSLFFCCTVFTTVGKCRGKVTPLRIKSCCCFL